MGFLAPLYLLGLSVGGGIPPAPPEPNSGGWYVPTRPPARRVPPPEIWPRYVEMPDGEIFKVADEAEYKALVAPPLAAAVPEAAERGADTLRLRQEMLELLDRRAMEDGMLRVDALIAEAAALYRARLLADDEALLAILSVM